MEIMKVKQFVKSKQPKDTDEELTQAFIEYLRSINNTRIKYQEFRLSGMVAVRLNPMINMGKPEWPLKEIYESLLCLYGDGIILLNKLMLTQTIYDLKDYTPRKGIIAVVMLLRR
jgi:hypothetical protein